MRLPITGLRGAAPICLALLSATTSFAQKPFISQHPQTQTTAASYQTTFSVVITNRTDLPTVQWRKDEQPIPGATNANFYPSGFNYVAYYSIAETGPSDAGFYSVMLSNTTGITISSNAQLTVVPPYTFITMAGLTQMTGTNDGLGSAARFYQPRHIARDVEGNLYVTDYASNTVRRITPGGFVSTYAGTPRRAGTNDGPANTALFNLPHGIAVDRNGNVFVTDLSTGGYGGTIRVITPDRVVTTIAGVQGVAGTNDGAGSSALFWAPWGIAVDAAGNVFVSDYSTIRELTTADGTNWTVKTIAGAPSVQGYANGTNYGAQFRNPDGLAFDSAGDIIVADELNNRIGRIKHEGTNWVTSTVTVLSFFTQPSAIAVDASDNIFVAAQGEHLIRRISLDGTNQVVTTIAGSYNSSKDGTGTRAGFNMPHGICLDDSGNLFVVEYLGSTLRKGWVSDVPPLTRLSAPIVSEHQVRLDATVITGTPTNFVLLQAEQLNGPWLTNDSALLTTNIPGLNYQFIAPLQNSQSEFYRLQH